MPSSICNQQLACDGAALRSARHAMGYCSACEKAMAKRGKVIAPRGINCDSNKTATEIKKRREEGTWTDW